jgi:hypothetical protein
MSFADALDEAMHFSGGEFHRPLALGEDTGIKPGR